MENRDTSQTVDDMLICLMNMGFDFGDCQDAIKMGKLSTSDAVEWLLAGKPKPSSSESHLVLHSGSTHVNEETEGFPNIPFTKPNPSATVDHAPHSIEEEDTADLKNPSSQKVYSRYAASREERGKIWEKKRKRIENEVKMDKLNKIKAKENVLKEIEADRRAQHNQRASPTVKSDDPTSSCPPSSSSTCSVQIRLPSGKAIREKFSSDLQISAIYDFVSDKLHVDEQHSLILLQPFPRLQLDRDNTSTLAQLGLCPSCTLVARLVADNNSDKADCHTADHMTNHFSEVARAVQFEPSLQRYSYTPPRVHHPGPSHHWPSSGGHRLGYDDDIEEASAFNANSSPTHPHEESLSDADESSPSVNLHGWGPGRQDENQPSEDSVHNPRERDAVEEMPSPFHEDYHSNHSWGPGRSLHDEEHPFDGSENVGNMSPGEDGASEREHRLRRDRIIQALEQRLLREQQESDEVSRSHASQQQDVGSLQSKCIIAVIHRLQAFGKEHLSSLGVLPTSLCNQILQELISRKMLKPNTITLFRSSPVMKLKLDYYIYATNQLMGYCHNFHGLRILSLRSCSLLTDQGMTVLKSLQRLRYLDVAGCVQLTDKFLSYLEDCRELSHLILDETHVTDIGLSRYLKSPPASLVYLSIKFLSGITERSFCSDLSTLRYLFVDRSGVTRLSDILKSASNLKHLTLSGCFIDLCEFQHLSALRHSLTSLNVIGVTSRPSIDLARDGEIGDYVMQQLQDLTNLAKLEFRFRHSLTSAGVTCLQRLPLNSLDLSHHRSIDDDALRHIGDFSSLTALDLSNCNITDAGLSHLTPILSRLNEFELDKTPITSRGMIDMFSDLQLVSNLKLLSLRQTKVGNSLLRSGVLDTHTPALATLNLSNTKVSDSGLRHLSLPMLTSLVLKDTLVRLRNRPESYPECPNLKHVHANDTTFRSGLESGSDEDDDV